MITERDQIWQSIKGSEKLYEIYGYYPTLHDANITNFDIRFESKEIILAFEYADGVEKKQEPDEYDGYTQIILCWCDVIEAKLRLYANEIYQYEFHRRDHLIDTRFSHSYGVDGYILAQGIDLISVAPSLRDTMKDDYLHTPNFTFAP